MAVDLAPVYLVTGADRPKVELAIQRLRRHFDDGSIDRFDAGSVGASEVIAACNTGTLLGGARLVLVDEVDGRPGSDGKLRATWKADDVKTIAAYLASPSPGTVLCLVGWDGRKDSALAKACAKAGQVLVYDVEKRRTTSWVADRFKANRVHADAEACALLVQLLGDDLHAIALEVDKLSAWAGPDAVVGEQEVHSMVHPRAEPAVFELTDAWGRRDAGSALRGIESILERSHRTHRDEVARISGALTSHLGRLRQMQAAAASGERPKETATRLKMHPFYAEKLARQAEAFSVEELDTAAVALADLDHALKGGSRLTPELELARAVTRITREPGARR